MPDLYLVDVFARRRYAGNQLAVVDCRTESMADEHMQAFAAEIDFSETTFVTGAPTDDGWPTRIFTPEAEIPFAGHPTLGTAHVVREHLAEGRPAEVPLDLQVGTVPVDTATAGRPDAGPGALWMTQQPPEFGEQVSHADLAAVLGVEASALDGDWPVQVISTGLPTIVVPVDDVDALRNIEIDRAAYDRVTGDREAKNVLAFTPGGRGADGSDRADGSAETDYAVRVFAPFYGVPEDPATGSSNGCLAAYLARHGDGSVRALVGQGHEMGRPSLVGLAAEDGGPPTVEVGGQVVEVARGDLL